MLLRSVLTICPACGKSVYRELGLCVICGQVLVPPMSQAPELPVWAEFDAESWILAEMGVVDEPTPKEVIIPSPSKPSVAWGMPLGTIRLAA